MNRKAIAENVKRRLWAESMGRCMNPECKIDLFAQDTDIMEKAHIKAYSETEDNSFENLIILCPSCHKKYDKTNYISEDIVREWKATRQGELDEFFGIKLRSFEELKNIVGPILSENYEIFTNYYKGDKKSLWEKFEYKLIANNQKLRLLLKNNIELFQNHSNPNFSNAQLIQKFIIHIDEFQLTRGDKEKNRKILFPKEVNSIFGITPIEGDIIPSVESLECLLGKYKSIGLFDRVILGIEKPYILLKNKEKIFINDTPRLRQLYYDNHCFRKTGVRFESLNFILIHLKLKGINFEYLHSDILRKVKVNNINITFIYEYCLSKVSLCSMAPAPNSIIVNLHTWNGKSCISKEALEYAKILQVQLLTQNEFYEYVDNIK